MNERMIVVNVVQFEPTFYKNIDLDDMLNYLLNKRKFQNHNAILYEREKYQTLLKEEKDPIKLVQYNARQMALKLLANAGYGVFAMETFDFSDYRVSEVITGYGRLIHKQLQKIALEKYGFDTVFGFTDSIFIKNASLETIKELILECKEKYHVVLEHKNGFTNTLIFDKTGNPADKPILKNLDGMSGRYPKRIKKSVAKIATYIITTDDHLLSNRL